MRTVVVINGVTGAIGSACLAAFAGENDTTIIGLSRRATALEYFSVDGRLPHRHLICSIGGDVANRKACESLAKALPRCEKLVYVHAAGVYPFELDSSGRIRVSHDEDGDGLDDRVRHLGFNAFYAMIESLAQLRIPLFALTFGAMADRHRPSVHRSWWTIMERLKERLPSLVAEHPHVRPCVLNISSVLCPNELIARPFVFTATDADAKCWLWPSEVAGKVVTLAAHDGDGSWEHDLFHHAPHWKPGYYDDGPFTERKRRELGVGGS